MQDFAQTLRSDATEALSPTSPRGGQGERGEKNDQTEEDANEEEKQDGWWSYVRKIPAAQLSSAVRLPENMDLARLREEMDQGTRFAEQYMQKFGADVMQVLSKTITVLDPEEEHDQDQRPTHEEPESRRSTSSEGSQKQGKRILYVAYLCIYLQLIHSLDGSL